MLPSIFVICFRLPMDSTSRWPYWPHNLSKEGMSSRLSYQRTCDTSVMSVIKQMTFLVIVYFSYCISASSIVENPSNDLVYNNQFAVNIPNASEVLVQFIAEKHGFRSLGQVTKLNTPNIEIVLEFPSLVYKWGKSCIYRLELSLNVFLFFLHIKTFIWSIHHWKGESPSTVIFFFNLTHCWSEQQVFSCCYLVNQISFWGVLESRFFLCV